MAAFTYDTADIETRTCVMQGELVWV